jgi:hypothetical protein
MRLAYEIVMFRLEVQARVSVQKGVSMTAFKRGDFVTLNDRLTVVVGIEGDAGVPEDHVALWYGAEEQTSNVPRVWTVPAEYCIPVTDTPIFYH